MAKGKTVRIKVFRFSELAEDVQGKIIDRRIKEMMEYEHEDHYENWPEYKKAIDEVDRLQTPWFASVAVWEQCGKEIVERLSDKHNETLYTIDGRIF